VNYNEDLKSAGLAYDFGFAAAHGAALARAVVGARPAEPVVLSVNYPAPCAEGGVRVAGPAGARSAGSLAGVLGAASVLTRAGRRDYPRAGDLTAREWADGEVRRMWLFGEPDAIIPELDGSLGTDIGALKEGYISVTPLSFAVELSDLSPPFQSFLARLVEAFPIRNAMATAAGEARP
jgi:broad specificity polyphosphatase/5'/3'-nucleotidase SurE